jgi:hypothetical protein
MRWGEGYYTLSRRYRREQDQWMPHYFYIPRMTREQGWVWLEEGEKKRLSGSNWDIFEYRVRGLD